MKTFIFTFFYLFAIVLTGNTQVLYGTTSGGGKYGGGTISKYDAATRSLNAVKNFNIDGSTPFGSLMRAADGKFYGMTGWGGGYNQGTIFSYNAVTNTYTQLAIFNGTNGARPQGSLMQASNGKLYGMTAEGGSSNIGVVFSFDLATSTLTKLHDFSGQDGNRPVSELIQASDGKLYGMTTLGGSSNAGVIFSYDPATSTYTKVYDFGDANGAQPNGSLMQASNGKLYGMTLLSTPNYGGWGTIFSFDQATSTYTKVYDFDVVNGAYPNGNLIQATDGKLYGLTRQGGENDFGVIFSFDIITSVYTKLYDFDGTNGAYPEESLMQASDGNLYGMADTYIAEDIDRSVIFSFNPSTSTYTTVHHLEITDGYDGVGNLIQGADGKLYAMAVGGSYSDGVIFSYDISTTAFTKLRAFGTNEDGRSLYGALYKASDGNLYGMTKDGGNYNDGVIFRYNPVTDVFTKLYDFNYTNGTHPYGSLVQATDGKLYGMTYSGGEKNWGVIFSYDPSTSTYTKLHEFDYANGGYPYGSLIQAADGKLYGMTPEGGSGGDGVIFSFDPTTSTYTIVYNFSSKNGAYPYGSLVQATNGKLYGMTYSGGESKYIYYGGAGVIFSFDPTTSTYTKLHDFDGTNGANPYGSLIQASDGKLYGMTYRAISFDGIGVIFSYDPSNSNFKKLHNFDGTNGANPQGSLLQASDGQLYGMTYGGGSNNAGVTFSYNPAASTGNYKKLADFTDTNGVHPYHTSFVEVSGTMPKINISDAIAFEGGSGEKKMNFKVSLIAASSDTIKVNYTTVNSTAKAPADYVANSGTLTFTPGTTAQTITVLIKGDQQIEIPELFKVQLSKAVNATISDNGVARGIILNDDLNRADNKLIAAGASTSVNNSVVVAPNPATSVVNLRLNGYKGNTTLQLTSLQGKLLNGWKLQGSASQQLNVSNLASGTYFLIVREENGYSQTVKLVIAR